MIPRLLGDLLLAALSELGQLLEAFNLAVKFGHTAWVQDGEGNRTTYVYDGFDWLVQTRYPLSALHSQRAGEQLTASGATTRFLYDGINLVAEYTGTNALLRRHVHGPGSDEPIVTYEGTTLTDRRFLMRDERGSIVSIANGSGSVTAINAYDGAAGVAEQHYGIGSTTVGSTTSAGTTGRFGYSGASGGVSGGQSASDTQMWLPELGLYHYRARIYSPSLGRFLQTDPIGYGDGMNLYAYVGNDPVNYVDPLGLFAGFGGDVNEDIVVVARSYRNAICVGDECSDFLLYLRRGAMFLAEENQNRGRFYAISRFEVELVLWSHGDAIRANLALLFGNEFTSRELNTLIRDIARTSITEREARTFGNVRPINGRVTLTTTQGDVINRVINELPRNALNSRAASNYRAALTDGRIIFRGSR